MKVAWFSPLNIDKRWGPSKAAYFTDIVLPLLSKECEIDLYHDSFTSYEDYPTYHYLKAFENDKADPYDIIFYNLEDAKWCNFVRSHIGLLPGVTYFHDFILSNYGPEPLLNSPYDKIIKKYFNNSLDWPIRDAKHLRKGPHAFREAAWSPVKIFATEHMLCDYKNVFQDCTLSQGNKNLHAFYLPYPILERESNSLKHTLKKIGFCGTPRLECRAHKLLSALKELQYEYQLIWLIEKEERSEVEQLLNEFEIKNFVLHEGRSPHAWSELLFEIDIAIHTFFSVYGNPYPYLSLSLKAGLPCIVSNFGSAEYLPANLVFKVQSGESESLEIAEVIEKLICNEVLFDPARVVEFARESYSVEGVVYDLVRIFRENLNFMISFRSKWREFQKLAERSLIDESKQFLQSPPNCNSKIWEGLPFNADNLYDQKISPIFKELGWY